MRRRFTLALLGGLVAGCSVAGPTAPTASMAPADTLADTSIFGVQAPLMRAIPDSAAAGLWAEPAAIAARTRPLRASGPSLFTIVEEMLAMQERERVGVLYFTLESRGGTHIDGKVHRSGFSTMRAIFVKAFLLPELLTFSSPSAFRSALNRALRFESIVRITGDLAPHTFTTPATSQHPHSFGRIYPEYSAPGRR